MGVKVKQGAWAEIRCILLQPEERAPQVPEDTRKVPLEMYAKGMLAEDTDIGQEATVVTRSGRRLTGTLVQENPAYEHRFGRPVEALLPIGDEVRSLLKKGGQP
jgi:hypothetical protein